MSTTGAAETGLRKSITKLQEKYEQLVKELQSVIKEQREKISLANETINAIVEVVGEEEVRLVMEATRKRQREELEAQAAKQLSLLKEKGILVPIEEVNDTATIVTRETHPDGKVLTEQYVMAKIPDAYRSLLVGKKVGESTIISEVKVDILEIYRFDKERADAAMKEEAEKAEQARQAMEVTKTASAAQLPELPPGTPVSSVEVVAPVVPPQE